MAKMTTRRKLAIATWRSPREGNMYGKMTLDATNVLAHLEKVREESGVKVTVSHLVGKAVAKVMEQAPTLNGRIAFGAFRPHKTVDVTYLVSLEGGTDLAKAKIENTNKKTLVEIAQELKEKAGKLKKGKDKDYESSKGLLKILPTWLLRPLIWLIGYLTAALGLSLKALGLERFPFGSCIVTSVGMFGVDEGYAPPTPFARVPLYVLVGAIKKMPVVDENDQVVIRQMITITATIDHRFIDGHQLGVLSGVIKKMFAEPELLDATE